MEVQQYLAIAALLVWLACSAYLFKVMDSSGIFGLIVQCVILGLFNAIGVMCAILLLLWLGALALGIPLPIPR